MKLLRKIPGWEKLQSSLVKLQELSFLRKLYLVYSIVGICFLYIHENHLPFLFILMLVAGAFAVATLLFFLISYAFGKLQKEKIRKKYQIGPDSAEAYDTKTIVLNPIVEIGIFLICIGLLFFTDFYSNRSGIFFVSVYCGVGIALRFLESDVFYRISLLGLMVLTAGLFSFKVLQHAEILTAYILFKPNWEQKELTDWTYDSQTRILSNADLHARLTLPEDYYFHNPKNLSLKDQTGTGQIAGIVSSSETDPNRYPSVRIFYFPEPFLELDKIKPEFQKFLDLAINQGDMTEVHELGEENFEKKMDGVFWTYYDNLRPRYAKTGFFIVSGEKLPDSFLLHVSENLVKGRSHEEVVEKILQSFKRE
ncbi:hypothetical protein EHQ12_14040 [Leptospira gomenensis]|uniref:Uncharacterized protein n=1 Tax=Leptospira gomenensis TaxID=2484974 RepID=A0A5F1Y5J0_9LEPT|nr:hypothetical protein [Leptospira gomenensis]TGK27972.1 hypothetical protein EHQ17_17925 [Leptospira gomenensis]TGK37173.1 hypothetical protein EHQ12_14040 [Leptospira gomenensis]TGK45809.1 hypothetical protein EHQ07_09050 [Leptospira gomenensis]TGK59748.1 hypothetical protein EHQ13_13260 [Leptospira gomenensis]